MSASHSALRRALVVDDEPDITRQIEEALVNTGWRVQCCADGRAAQDAIDTFNPLVVVLDLRMPKMSGMQLLRELHARRPWTQVIILTGHGTEDDAMESVNNNAFRFLRKPVSPLQIADHCEEAIKSIPGAVLAFYHWYKAVPNPDTVVFQTASGRQVSAKKLMDEIERQTSEGQEFLNQVTSVAIELISKRL